jgi:hypothetical protein
MGMHYKPTGHDDELVASTICIGRDFIEIKPARRWLFDTPIT